ncbi:MAG: hypothetical protein ACQEQU_04585 [Spirochaetota bacterium]
MNILEKLRIQSTGALIWSAQAVGAVVPTPLAITSAFVLTLMGHVLFPTVSLLRGVFTIGECTL